MNSDSPAALVTGASRGIGRGISVSLAGIGWSVLINYAANADAAAQCRDLCRQASPAAARARFELCQADISNQADRLRLVEFARAEFGWLDLLVNNAGVAPKVRADVLETSEESLDRLWSVNVKGPYLLTQAVANWWLSQPDHPRRLARPPQIVTVSSISAYTASINRGDYCLSKAALSMLTKLFAARLADHGIRVYELRPGVIATDMTSGVKDKYDRLISQGLTPIRRWGTPEDVGRAVAAIAENRLPFSTGEIINVDGGFHLHRL